MAFVKLDEKFHWHRKTKPLSDAAYRLFIGGLCYANLFQTDGILLLSDVDMVTSGIKSRRTKDAIEELVGVWWERVDEGFRILNYLEYQFSKAQIDSYRDKKVAAGAKGGKKSGEVRREASASPHLEADASRLLEPKVVSRSEPSLREPSLAEPDQATKKLGLRVIEWFCDRKGWDLGMPADITTRERTIALNIAAMPLTEDLLFATLNEVWMRCKKPPATLNYFSGALEEAVSENKSEPSATRGFDGGLVKAFGGGAA